jgi:hypothetical protein
MLAAFKSLEFEAPMTFQSVLNRVPAKLCLLLLVSSLFTHPTISATTHPRPTALASALQHSHGVGSAVLIVGIIAAAITTTIGIIVAIIYTRGKK